MDMENQQSNDLLSELGPNEIADILDLTIKADRANKIATLLCMVSAFSEESQFNISFNAPSSSGKSYIALEIAALFPPESVLKLAYASPTAFFHEQVSFDKERNAHVVDLARRIIVFVDMPHTDLLARLRPLLSHDEREVHAKITDKTKSAGLRAKTVIIRGFPSVIFCTAGLKTDEQEATRFLLLSPETSQGKIRDAIKLGVWRATNPEEFSTWLNAAPRRRLLMRRIEALRNSNIRWVRIADGRKIEQRFLETRKTLKPRHARDVRRVISLVQAFALLNFPHRERDGEDITASANDIDWAFESWDQLSEAQEYDIAPYLLQLYREVIIAEWRSYGGTRGITSGEIIKAHHIVYGRPLPDWQLRQQVLPPLESAGLISLEADPNDKRRKLVVPLALIGPETRP
ncbi:MAG: hypothetical protein WC654_07145 [Patescibacteria group bacterium]